MKSDTRRGGAPEEGMPYVCGPRTKAPPPPPPGNGGGQGGTPPPERRGTRSSGVKEYTAVEDLVPLLMFIFLLMYIKSMSGVRPGMNVPLATRFLGSKPHCTSAVGEVSLVDRTRNSTLGRGDALRKKVLERVPLTQCLYRE